MNSSTIPTAASHDPLPGANPSLKHAKTHSTKNEYIHGLRGMLAFAVFCFHIENSGLPTFDGPLADAANILFASMRHGVEIFFGISGIVIFHSYQTSKSNRAFFLNRVTRILPVLWVTILIILLGARFDSRHDDSLAHFGAVGTLSNLFALPSLFPVDIINPTAWTLSYEFAFYICFILFSLIAGVLGTASGVPICILIAMVLLASHLKALLFLSGILIVISSDGVSAKSLPFRFPLLSIALSMVLWDQAFTMLGKRADDIGLLDLVHGGPGPILLFILAGCIATFGLAGVFFGNGEATILKTPVMRWLGTISFSLYMWQPITAAVTKKFIVHSHLDVWAGNWSQILFFFMALPTTLLVAHFSQVLIEEHFTKYLRKIFKARGQIKSTIQ